MQRKKLIANRGSRGTIPPRVLPERTTRSEAVLEHLRARLHFDAESTEVLDFGCGSGYLAFLLAPFVRRLTAVEHAPQLIAKLNANLSMSRVKNIRALNLDLRNAARELAGAKFDLIVCMMTLHHFADVESLCGELKTLLKPDGILCLVDLATEDGSFHAPNVPVAHTGFSRDDFTKWLTNAGYFKLTFDTPYTIQRVVDDVNVRNYPLLMVLADNQYGNPDE